MPFMWCPLPSVHSPSSLTIWFNLTAHTLFNAERARKVFEYFESLARQEIAFDYFLNTAPAVFVLGVRPRKERVLVLIGEKDPKPNWFNLTTVTGGSTGQFADKPYRSFVRLYQEPRNLPPSTLFNTIPAFVNRTLAVEAFQTAALIRSQTTDYANLGQELVANSLGAVFAAIQMELSEEQIKSYLAKTRISPDGKGPGYPLVNILASINYKDIPKIGHVLTPR